MGISADVVWLAQVASALMIHYGLHLTGYLP